MGLEKVIERIQKEGEEKIRNILLDAEQQAAEMLQKTQQRMDERALKRRQEMEKQITTMKLQEQSSFGIESKKIRLNQERDILAMTYRECLVALQSLPHQKILSSLLKTVRDELPDAAFIYSNKRDESLLRSLSKIPYGGTIDCIGGLIVENAYKTLKLDCRYDTIAEVVWDKSLKEIAETVFGDR